VAKTELAEVNATVKNLAAQFVSASADMKASLAPELEVAAQKAAATKVELAALNAEMRESVHPEVSGFFGHLGESVRLTGESFETLHARLAVFSNAIGSFSELLVAGLALEQVAETINHVAESGEQMRQVSEETGLTTEQLSGLKVMATETGANFDEFVKLIDKLPNTMQMAATGTGVAAEAFRAMGIHVTDSSGRLRPMGDVLDEVSAKLASYADGTNKTALETDIFGAKIGASLIPMLNQLGEIGLQGAIEKSNELGQTWTGQSAEAAEQYESDMRRAKLAVDGITDSIVRGLLPALDAVANSMAPTLDTQIASVQAAIAKGGVGIHGGAELPALNQQLANLEAQKKMLDDSIAKQRATAGGAAPATAQAPSVSNASQMKDMTATLDAENAKIEQNASSTKEANQEKLQNAVQYWRGVLQAGNLSGQEELQARDALSKAETAMRQSQLGAETSAVRSAATEQKQIAQDAAAAQKEIEAAQYQAKVQTWDTEVAEGAITKAQEVQNEIQAEQNIYEAQLAAMQKQAALDQQGTAAKAKALDDIKVYEAQHVAEMARLDAQLTDQQVQEANKVAAAQKQAADKTKQAWQQAFQPITQAFDTSINGILQGTQTLQNAEAKAAQSITLAFIDAEAKKLMVAVASEAQILAHGVATQMGLTAATEAGETARLSAKVAGDAQGRAVSLASGVAQINNDAMKAAAGAFSAVAGIPYIGPVLAPAAAAAAYTAVMGFEVLSAEGGTVIPAGVNPLTQLHEKEMVLPAHIAQPLLGMVSGGGMDAGGGGDTYNLHFNNSVAHSGGSSGVS
ncbi:MAG: hypothetical protein KGH75_12150, partial [Rhodospirillales bacterium]|nr:hypothetical protein [Rhodospirillales bacterium]